MKSQRCGRYFMVAGTCLMASAVILVIELKALGPPYPHPMRINCVNNLKQIGLAFKTWALENSNCYPFSLSTNAGGTRELCALDISGFDYKAVCHLKAISNELTAPTLLVCPQDKSKTPAADFGHLTPSNVTYRFHSGTSINEGNPTAVLAVCPVDGNTLFCDGSVKGSNGEQNWLQRQVSSLDIATELYPAVSMAFGATLVLIGMALRARTEGRS